MRRNVMLLVLIVVTAGCGEATTPSTTPGPAAALPAADATVAVVEFTGGCFMGGPNCSRYEVRGDGSFDLFRLGIGAPTAPEITGRIDPDLVVDLYATAAATDLEALRRRLAPGQCWGCVDGIDTSLTVVVEGAASSFSSVDVAFDLEEPLFAAAERVTKALTAAADLPLATQ